MENEKLNLTIDNNNKNKKIKNKIFKSASITFYSKKLGYLLCEEFRYKEKKILLHPIGGKVENFDKDIFTTAIREFIEEVNLELHPILNANKYDKNTLTENMCEILQNLTYYIDLCINKENKYFHRYFLTLTDNIEDNEFKSNIIELPNYFNGNYKTEINNIHWLYFLTEKKDTKSNLSWLTKMFLNFVIKKNI
jgi:8-oxo-dGTP pyrophosphatase MutT (NUDIX family)